MFPLIGQATSVSTITDGITGMLGDGGTVAVAALGIFVAVMAVRVIKKFARAGA